MNSLGFFKDIAKALNEGFARLMVGLLLFDFFAIASLTISGAGAFPSICGAKFLKTESFFGLSLWD